MRWLGPRVCLCVCMCVDGNSIHRKFDESEFGEIVAMRIHITEALRPLFRQPRQHQQHMNRTEELAQPRVILPQAAYCNLIDTYVNSRTN